MERNNCAYETIDVLGYKVFSSSLNDIDSDIVKVLINTFSPNSYGIALKDDEFKTSLKNSDILVLDGMGIAIGSLLLHGRNIKKIAGQDCFDHLMLKANELKWRVFFFGSSESTLRKIEKRASVDFPNIIVGSYSPPFKAHFSPYDDMISTEKINTFQPDVLFVGLTAPKQEKWAYAHRDSVNARIISTIGNVFDWYAGNSKRPSKFWIALRLEWLVRIFYRPEILRRNLRNQMKFFRDLLLHISLLKRIN